MALPPSWYRFALLLAALGTVTLVGQAQEKGATENSGAALEPGSDRPLTIHTPKAVKSAIQRTISQSGQFTVYGTDGLVRSEFANACEDLRRDFEKVLRLNRDGWRINWVVQIHTSESPRRVSRRAAGSIRPIDNKSVRFQFDVLKDPDFTMEEFREEFLLMQLLEVAYDQPELKVERTIQLPKWLIAGLAELVEYRENGTPTELFQSLIKARQTMPISEVLTADPKDYSDSVRKKVFRASSAALLKALLQPLNGPQRLEAFLQDLALENASAEEALNRHFGMLRQDENGLEKWWILQMVTMGQRTIFEFYTVEETEQVLSQALMIREVDFVAPEAEEPTEDAETRLIARLPKFGRKKGQEDEVMAFKSGTLRDFESFSDHPRSAAVLNLTRERLLGLQKRVFPLYRPIVAQYDLVIAKILAGENKEASILMAELELSRTNTQRRMDEVNRHMNWYVTTQSEGAPANNFANYEKVEKEIEALEKRRRADPISQYLDQFDRLFAP